MVLFVKPLNSNFRIYGMISNLIAFIRSDLEDLEVLAQLKILK